MPFTFQGTYTKNDGDEPASGTITVTHVDGTTATADLDENGAYSIELDAGDGTVTLLEALDGIADRTEQIGVSDGATIDTSYDIGRVGISATVGATGPTGPVGATGPAGSYTLPDPLPEVPHTPTAQDIVDALVALGLVTQASS